MMMDYVKYRFPDYESDQYLDYWNGSSEQKWMLEERNDLLMQLTAVYISTTGDYSALDLWDKTWESYFYDETLLGSINVNVISSGYAPQSDYCDNMLGNYQENHHLVTQSATPKMGYDIKKENCEEIVAAHRSFIFREDRCTTELPDRLASLDLSTEELNQSIADCQDGYNILVSKTMTAAESFYQSPSGEEMEKSLSRWVLTEVRLNPNNEPTYFEGGVPPPPYWYNDLRYEGKFLDIKVMDGSIIYHDFHFDHEFCYDATFVADFEAPPASMAGGEEISLTATASGSGTSTGKDGCGVAGIQFQYRYGSPFVGSPVARTDLEFVPQTFNDIYKAINVAEGAEFIISAFLWNCPACLVQYVYTGRKYDLIEAFMSEIIDQPTNLVQLNQYYDVTHNIADAINHLKYLSGAVQDENEPRLGDLTGDGKVGIDDTIRVLQILSQ